MPGGSICSVAICKSNSKKAKEMGEQLMFFTFPSDPAMQKKWIRKCYRKDKFQPKFKRICSRHFRPEDYEDELQARVMGTQPKKLKKSAIPSLHLRPGENTIGAEGEKPSKRTKRVEQKERKQVVEKLLAEQCSVDSEPSPTKVQLEITEERHEADNSVHEMPSCSKDSENDILKRQLEQLRQENAQLKSQIVAHANNEQVLQQRIFELEQELRKANVSYDKKVKLALKDVLTSNQVDIALNKKVKARWSQEELSRAFTLRYFSKRAYIYLRNSLHYPLPGLSTLQQWAANINLRNGVLDDVLRIMDTTGKTKNNLTRTTVLSFDEVKVASLFEYDSKDDEVLGPHTYMQVIMARGLFDSWKQPVYIGFDQKVTKDLLTNVVTKLHEINYNVVACVSDCGGGNQGLWKELNITPDNTFWLHPVTEEPIYFFADIPHLLKLLRNWFLDTGFMLKNGTILNKTPLEALITCTRTEISSCHKLTPLHVSCEKTQRQNVKLAAQLFSNTTATALKRYLPGENKKLAKDVADFIELVNNWFDIFNSYTPRASVPTKKPYGLDKEMQDNVLEHMKNTINDMLCCGKKSLQVFQKGILISTKSLQNLYEDLQGKLDCTYLLTHRLNQDCLENLFSQLRTRGGLHDHPSPLNALYRLRMILLGKNPGIVQQHANVEAPSALENGDYLVASALKQAHITDINVPPLAVEELDAGDKESTTSSSSCSTSSASREISEKDGLLYLAGYLAKRHLQEYPSLGQYSHTLEAVNIHSYSMPSWVQSLSFGGLIEPSQQWMEQVSQMEKYFHKLHKDNFKQQKKVVKTTAAYICKKTSGIPQPLIKAFSRQRIFVRIKFLNLKREEVKLGKRKAHATGRKLINKMKKIVN